jgi:exopolyphosphatase/guanosine-5'-triphosphate,3'-diphosphate pyrophosphatase
LPKSKHPEWAEQSKALRHRVKWLAGILRIADALDRSHFGVVDSVEVKVKKKAISFYLNAHNDAEYELWDARQKCDLFEELAGRDLFFLLKEKAAMPSGKVLRGQWDRDNIEKVPARLKGRLQVVK